MQLKNLFADEDAVSPVIGVILMVAITVILAAVIGAFVLGIGGSQEKTPQASFEYTIETVSGTDKAVVTHQGGDAINPGQISFSGAYSLTSTNVDHDDSNTDGDWNAGETMTAAGGNTWSTGDEVQVVWSSSQSDSTNIIGSGTL